MYPPPRTLFTCEYCPLEQCQIQKSGLIICRHPGTSRWKMHSFCQFRPLCTTSCLIFDWVILLACVGMASQVTQACEAMEHTHKECTKIGTHGTQKTFLLNLCRMVHCSLKLAKQWSSISLVGAGVSEPHTSVSNCDFSYAYCTAVRFKALIWLIGLGFIRVGLGLIWSVVRAMLHMHI